MWPFFIWVFDPWLSIKAEVSAFLWVSYWNSCIISLVGVFHNQRIIINSFFGKIADFSLSHPKVFDHVGGVRSRCLKLDTAVRWVFLAKFQIIKKNKFEVALRNQCFFTSAFPYSCGYITFVNLLDRNADCYFVSRKD